MPYLIDMDGPIDGTIAIGRSLTEIVGDIPGLVGAWTTVGLPEGKLTNWPARVGGGVLTQANALRAPDVTTQGGRYLIMSHVGCSLGCPHVWADGGLMTVAMRAYFAEPAIDLQYLFGFSGGATYSLVYRSASGRLILDAGADVPVPLSAGWHDIIITQGAATSRVEIDGAVYEAANAGKPGTSLVLFNRLINSSSGGWRGGISRLVLAEADLWGTPHYSAAQTWCKW